jgi:hypothetical protein
MGYVQNFLPVLASRSYHAIYMEELQGQWPNQQFCLNNKLAPDSTQPHILLHMVTAAKHESEHLLRAIPPCMQGYIQTKTIIVFVFHTFMNFESTTHSSEEYTSTHLEFTDQLRSKFILIFMLVL